MVFVAIPGGVGTLEEIFEQWTWAQLGIHLKPCAFLNVDGFYDDLLKFLTITAEKGFHAFAVYQSLIWWSRSKLKLWLSSFSICCPRA